MSAHEETRGLTPAGLWRRLMRRLDGPRLSERVRRAVAAREVLGEDFFGGWEPADIDLFRRHARAAPATPGMFTDYFGIRTSAAFHPWAVHMSGTTIADLPIPDDRLRAEAIEYFALLHSLESAAPGAYAIVELGASYGPWICAAAILARRTGRTHVRLVGVEASPLLFDMMSRHLAENDVSGPDIDIRLVQGAVAAKPGPLLFPKVAGADDNGSRAVESAGATDYLGRHIEHEEVAGYVLADLIPDGVTDLLHIDIQGGESEVLRANAALLNAHVRSLFVGTHARKIEGELLEFFHANGWRLVRERPTQFTPRRHLPDIVGWTSRDGGQYWINERL